MKNKSFAFSLAGLWPYTKWESSYDQTYNNKSTIMKNIKLLLLVLIASTLLMPNSLDAQRKSRLKPSGKNMPTWIMGMGIDKKNQVYTWYNTGDASIGSSKNLTKIKNPYHFPAKKKGILIVGSAISKENSRIYTWYSNNTVSIGDMKNLEQFSNSSYTLPPGKTRKDVIDFGIATDNTIYTWYKDGTVSKGTATDLDKLGPPIKFTPATGKLVKDIAGIAISKNNITIAWYKDGTASQGSTRDLDKKRKPYKYSKKNTVQPVLALKKFEYAKTVNGLTSIIREKRNNSKPFSLTENKGTTKMNGYDVCNTHSVNVEGSNSDFLIANHISSSYIWPGAMYHINDFHGGSYKEAASDNRGKITLTSTFLGGDGTPVTKSNILREEGAINTAKKNIVGTKTSNDFGSTTKTRTEFIGSESDFKLKTNKSIGFLGFEGKSMQEIKDSDKNTRLYLELTQEWFTLKIVAPENPDQLFQNPKQATEDPNLFDWVYVNSVTYGRKIIATFESNEHESSFRSDFEAGMDWVFVKGNAKVQSHLKNKNKSFTIKILALGGDAGSQAVLTATSWAELENKISSDKWENYFQKVIPSQAFPLTYSLKRVATDELVEINTTGNYTYQSCFNFPKKWKMEIVEVLVEQADDGGNDEQLYLENNIKVKSNGKYYMPQTGDVCSQGLVSLGACKAILNFGSEDDPIICREGFPQENLKNITLQLPLKVMHDPNAVIQANFHLYEEDDFGDDDFGKWSLAIKMSDFKGGVNVFEKRFFHDNSIVKMVVSLTPLY